MSHMNLYIKKEGVLKRATISEVMVKDLLFKGLKNDELERVFKRSVKESLIEPYDSGLFLIDADSKAITSAQTAFELESLGEAVKRRISKGWKYSDVKHDTAPAQLISVSPQ